MAELSSYIPNFGNLIPNTDVMLAGIFALLFGVALVLFWQLSRHRIWVDIYEQVKEGTVSSGGRYRRDFDTETKMYFLKPLFGGNRLPDFDNENFQKVSSVPVFGMTRQIKLIKVNNWSYYTVSPDHNTNNTCIAKYKDSISWVHSELMRDFKKRINTGRIYQLLIISAPIIVFILCFLFLGIAIWTDINIIQLFQKKLDIMTEAILNK